MNLYDLSLYDTVVMWGAGKDALWYDKQFRLDYFVDKNEEKIGSRLKEVEVVNTDYLLETNRQGKSILIIVSSSKFKREILNEIKKMSINADVTELSVMKYLYGRENMSFALWGLDILIKDLLIRGGYDVSKMSYIEVGACHPILGSNSYNAYLLGARGILVEPNPNLLDDLKKYRKDECVMEGIASENGSLLYYKFNNEYRNTFDRKEADDAINKGFKLIETVELPVEKLDDIIEKYNVDTENTFLSIQVMGLENEIIKNFNYKNYHFPLIVLAVYSDDIYQCDLFKDYHVIAEVPRHIVLVNDSIYNKILC